jgi:hypothetical protein
MAGRAGQLFMVGDPDRGFDKRQPGEGKRLKLGLMYMGKIVETVK